MDVFVRLFCDCVVLCTWRRYVASTFEGHILDSRAVRLGRQATQRKWKTRNGEGGRNLTGHVLQTPVTYTSVASVSVSFKLMHPTESSLGGQRQPAIHRAAPTGRLAYISESKGHLAATAWREAGTRGSAVVKALCYKTEDRGFETRWRERIFSMYLILKAALGPGVHSASNRNEYQKQKNNISSE
jgi:hypothetical protein